MRKYLAFAATTVSLAVIVAYRTAPADVGIRTYQILMTQPDDPSTPITYSSCEPILVEINTDGIDDEAIVKKVMLRAMGEISAASQLQLVYVGPTERRPNYPANVLGSS